MIFKGWLLCGNNESFIHCQTFLREHKLSLLAVQCSYLPYTKAACQILLFCQDSTLILNQGEIKNWPFPFSPISYLHLTVIKDSPNLYLNRRLIWEWQCNWKCFINYKVPCYVMTNVIVIINNSNIISNKKKIVLSNTLILIYYESNYNPY